MLALLCSILLWLLPTRDRIQADKLVGRWESVVKDGRMEFYADGKTYAARILWGNKAVEADGKTSRKDLKNPDPARRTQDILGMTYITGLAYDRGDYTGGSLYNPLDGKTYRCKIHLAGDELYLRVYVGVPLLGETRVWRRMAS